MAVISLLYSLFPLTTISPLTMTWITTSMITLDHTLARPTRMAIFSTSTNRLAACTTVHKPISASDLPVFLLHLQVITIVIPGPPLPMDKVLHPRICAKDGIQNPMEAHPVRDLLLHPLLETRRPVLNEMYLAQIRPTPAAPHQEQWAVESV